MKSGDRFQLLAEGRGKIRNLEAGIRRSLLGMKPCSRGKKRDEENSFPTH